MIRTNVAIVGAGPVGLLLASFLGKAGIDTLLLEKRSQPRKASQAIGITPPSLEILDELGLADSFIQAGTRIQDCFVHDDDALLGCASFRNLAGKYPFILALPQSINEALLRQHLSHYASLKLMEGAEVKAIRSADNTVHLTGDGFEVEASWVVACDGHRSALRDLLVMPTQQGVEPDQRV